MNGLTVFLYFEPVILVLGLDPKTVTKFMCKIYVQEYSSQPLV